MIHTSSALGSCVPALQLEGPCLVSIVKKHAKVGYSQWESKLSAVPYYCAAVLTGGLLRGDFACVYTHRGCT